MAVSLEEEAEEGEAGAAPSRAALRIVRTPSPLARLCAGETGEDTLAAVGRFLDVEAARVRLF
ncbi:MAG: hypothetical protein ACK4QW_19525, partial [Alphaproteobacteria bacterium]